MKGQRRFPARSLAIGSLIAVSILASALLASAQAGSAPSIASLTIPFTTLVNFNGTNGANSQASFVEGRDGYLYGTTPDGGANNAGVLFKMTPGGTLTTLYSFCAEAGCTDGSGPGGLTLGRDGNIYGLTGGGGTFGYGTVFKFTGAASPITLHNFDGTDGSGGGYLVQASDGKFYGTTAYGANFFECLSNGCGTIFEMTPSGTLTTLHAFCSELACADGAILYEYLALGPGGNYYGATFGGGTANCGTVFNVTPKGELTTIYTFGLQFYPFCNGNPVGLVLGTEGNFYGVTLGGQGGRGGQVTVFRITPKGELTTIHNFCSQTRCTDGSTPRVWLTLGSDRNLYGTTYFGGAYNQGTVFQITPAGVLTTLHSFNGKDGNYPIGALYQARNGSFYGTTSVGGVNGVGTIFSLSVGIGVMPVK